MECLFFSVTMFVASERECAFEKCIIQKVFRSFIVTYRICSVMQNVMKMICSECNIKHYFFRITDLLKKPYFKACEYSP